MAALILYDITQLNTGAIIKNSMFLTFGSILIWALCGAGFEIVAWILLALPLFFLVGLAAFLVVTQIIGKSDTINMDGTTETVYGNFNKPTAGQNEEAILENSVEKDLERVLGSSDDASCGKPKPQLIPVKLWKIVQAPAQTMCSTCNAVAAPSSSMCPTCSAVSTSS
jgi:hypothetical protein